MWEYGCSLTRIFLFKDKIVDSVLIRGSTVRRKPVFSHILQSVRKKTFGSLKLILYSLNLPFSISQKNLLRSRDKRKDNYWVENPSNLVRFRWVIQCITVKFKENKKILFIVCTIDLHMRRFGSATSASFSWKLVRSSLVRTNPQSKTKAKMKTIFISVSN